LKVELPGMQKQLEKRLRLNNQIRAPLIQIIDFDGKQLGTMPVYEALRIANERNLDLVEVGPSANPPLAKIMDYGKYMYQKEKRERENKAGKSKQTAPELKTIKIGFKTGIHDLSIRSSQTDKFLGKGHRVRIEMNLRGREKAMGELARTKMEGFLKLITPPYSIDEPINRMPSGLGKILRPEK
jgi:translation initiation factor IF-3